jgi:hypothetical protein
MNRILLAGVLAIVATALGHQDAKAWHEFNMSGGFNISCKSGGHCFTMSSASDPYPYCSAPGYAAPTMQSGHPAPPPTAVPPPTPVQKSGYQGWDAYSGYQAVGYYIPQAPYGYGYGYNYAYGYGNSAVPAYWYGR